MDSFNFIDRSEADSWFGSILNWFFNWFGGVCTGIINLFTRHIVNRVAPDIIDNILSNVQYKVPKTPLDIVLKYPHHPFSIVDNQL